MSATPAAKRKRISDDLIVFHVNITDKLNGDGVYSPEHVISGIPWKIRVVSSKKDDGKHYLSYYLHCYIQQRYSVWYYYVSFEITLVNRLDATKSISHKYSGDGVSEVISMEELIKPEKGFLKDGQIIVQAKITEGNFMHNKFRIKPTFDMFSPSKLSDGILVVDGTKFYVNKQILTLQSPFFDRLFDRNIKDSKEIFIEDVDKNIFEKLIKVLYPIDEEYTDETVASLLELGHRFEINNVINNAELFLLCSSTMDVSKKLLLADKFKLPVLLDDCISNFEKCSEIRELKKSEEYLKMSDSVTRALFEKLIEMCKC